MILSKKFLRIGFVLALSSTMALAQGYFTPNAEKTSTCYGFGLETKDIYNLATMEMACMWAIEVDPSDQNLKNQLANIRKQIANLNVASNAKKK